MTPRRLTHCTSALAERGPLLKTLCIATSFRFHAVHTLVRAELVKPQKFLLNDEHGAFPS